MRVLVCGGREYRNSDMVHTVLSTLHQRVPITRLIHGGARGADTLGGLWAASCGIAIDVYRADWEAHGKGAGHKRNTRMLVEGKPDLVVAFPGGRGTENMVGQSHLQAKKTGWPYVLKINENYIESHIEIIALALSTEFNKRRKSDVSV